MYHRRTQANWNVCSAKYLDLGPEHLRSALARIAKLVGRCFSDGRDYQLPDWLLLSSVVGPRGSIVQWCAPRGLITCLGRAMLSPRCVLVKSRSRALCGTSRLGGVTRDMQTPDPPVEPMGVLQRKKVK